MFGGIEKRVVTYFSTFNYTLIRKHFWEPLTSYLIVNICTSMITSLCLLNPLHYGWEFIIRTVSQM